MAFILTVVQKTSFGVSGRQMVHSKCKTAMNTQNNIKGQK